MINLRLKTSLDNEAKLIELQSGLQFSTKAAVMRLAIGFSLKVKGDPRVSPNNLIKNEAKEINGADYHRYTILGSDDLVYKILFEEHLGNKLDDKIFFPEMVNAHIDRGLDILYSDYKISKNRDSFFSKILDEAK